MMANIWNKILAVLAGILAFLSGIFAFLFQREKNKQIKDKLKANEEELEKVKEGNREYVKYKKGNEEVISDAISGDPDALLQLMQNNTEAGRSRNIR